MQEMQADEQRFFSDLSRQERWALRKEYSAVHPRNIILFVISILLLLASATAGVFSVYHMIQMLYTFKYTLSIPIWAFIFTASGFASLFVSKKRMDGFNKWLLDEKNIRAGKAGKPPAGKVG